jgi:hypothetical protein
MIRHRVFHPLLFALYPIAALTAYNLDWLRPTDALRAALMAVAVACLLLVALAYLLKDWHRAGLLVSLMLLVFFSYGHLYGALKAAGLGASVGRHRFFAPLFLAVAAALAWWILRRVRRPEAATGILNLVAAVALAFPLFTLIRWTVSSLTEAPAASSEASNLQVPEGERPPDIYYIIVDAYARQDTLQKVFDYNNTPFLDFLREQGFYIADASTSNYSQTALSLSSSLNMNYLDALLPDIQAAAGRGALWRLIKHSAVRRQLEDLGYVTVAFSTGLSGTEWTDADYYYTAGGVDENFGLGGVSPFETLLVQTSLLRLVSDGIVALPRFVPDVAYPYEVHRARIRNIFAHLGDLPQTDQPKFVFAHIISPHPPFVFAPDGSPVTPDVPFSLRFTDAGGDQSSADYIRGYRDQVAFVNAQLEAIIPAILEHSEVPPVIIIQGDHGPDSNSGKVSYIQERMTNLNAYLLPHGKGALYPGITPVNSFRVVLDQLFDGKLPLLPDRVLYSEYDTPYKFHDETEAIRPPQRP